MNDETVAAPSRIPVYLLLIVLVLAVYAQIIGHDFVTFDDVLYVSGNPHINSGLSSENISWAFASSDQNRTYWHPLTWVSHMLDSSLFGLDAGGHHLVNVLIHLINSFLLFLIFYRMTGALWPSGLVALLFALHPVNVDSVAWLAQRKSVLSTLFCLLTMSAHLAWCKCPTFLRYLRIMVLFCLGLLAKPVLVVLPCILLLLDYWPLGRLRQLQWLPNAHIPALAPMPEELRVGFVAAIIEKIPLLALSSLSIGVTMLWPAGVNVSWELRGLGLRLANAIVSMVHYLATVVVPQNLAVFYPYPTSVPAWKWIPAVLIVLLVTAAAVINWRRRPYLIVGWLWFAGSLVPISGLLQQGLWPARADRWAYLPFIGIFIMLAWGGAEIISRYRINRRLVAVMTAAIILTLALTSWYQASHWRNSIDLYEHTLSVTENNHVIHTLLGVALIEQGKIKKAAEQFRAAVEIEPNFVNHINYGAALINVGPPRAATDQFRAALDIDENSALAHNGLGLALCQTGDFEPGVLQFKEALKIDEGFSEARDNLERALREYGRELVDEAGSR